MRIGECWKKKLAPFLYHVENPHGLYPPGLPILIYTKLH